MKHVEKLVCIESEGLTLRTGSVAVQERGCSIAIYQESELDNLVRYLCHNQARS